MNSDMYFSMEFSEKCIQNDTFIARLWHSQFGSHRVFVLIVIYHTGPETQGSYDPVVWRTIHPTVHCPNDPLVLRLINPTLLEIFWLRSDQSFNPRSYDSLVQVVLCVVGPIY